MHFPDARKLSSGSQSQRLGIHLTLPRQSLLCVALSALVSTMAKQGLPADGTQFRPSTPTFIDMIPQSCLTLRYFIYRPLRHASIILCRGGLRASLAAALSYLSPLLSPRCKNRGRPPKCQGDFIWALHLIEPTAGRDVMIYPQFLRYLILSHAEGTR